MAFLQIDGLTKLFEGTAAVDRLSLSVEHLSPSRAGMAENVAGQQLLARALDAVKDRGRHDCSRC